MEPYEKKLAQIRRSGMGMDLDLYFCGSYGKIEKRLFDVGGSRFQGSTPGRSARRIAGDSGDRSEALKGREMSRETKKKVRSVDRGKAFGCPLRRVKRFACPDETGGPGSSEHSGDGSCLK